LQATEFNEQDNHTNSQIENSPNILERDNLEDVVYIDSVQEDEHVSWAKDDTSFDSALLEPSSCKWINKTVNGNISRTSQPSLASPKDNLHNKSTAVVQRKAAPSSSMSQGFCSSGLSLIP
jgi:hypothetical protein